MKKHIVLFLSFQLFICSFIISSAHAGEADIILLSNTNERVSFPYYIKYISPIINQDTLPQENNSYRTKLSSNELHRLKLLLRLLPDAIKSIWFTNEQTITIKTQFDLPKLNLVVASKIEEMNLSYKALGQLIDASDQLQMTLISNAISHHFYTQKSKATPTLTPAPRHAPTHGSTELSDPTDELIYHFIEYGI